MIETMSGTQQFVLGMLTPILTFLGTIVALWYAHLKTRSVITDSASITNKNIENVENHLGILPTQIHARLDPSVPGSITNKESVERAVEQNIQTVNSAGGSGSGSGSPKTVGLIQPTHPGPPAEVKPEAPDA